MIDYTRALGATATLVGKEWQSDVEGLLRRFYPDITAKSQADVEAKSSKFRYRSIVRFAAEHQAKFASSERPFLINLIPAYAELSSYTHGGPAAESEQLGHKTDEDIDASGSKIGSWAFFLSAGMWTFALMMLAKDSSSVHEAHQNVHRILKNALAK